MSTGIRPVVESVVDTQVQAGNMFTAHDVTLEVRNRGHRAGHTEVRDAVHDYYSRGGMGVAYTRSTITVPLGGTPFLYHRQVDDPTAYTNIRGQGQVPTPASSTIAVPPPASITSSSDGDGDDDGDDDDDGSAVPVPVGMTTPSFFPTVMPPLPLPSVAGVAVAVAKSRNKNAGIVVGRTVDRRETLSVPTTLIRTAGFRPNQKVTVSVVGQTLEITSKPQPNILANRKYTVDKYGQIRITQHMLKRAGIGGTSYDLSGVADKIVVKAH